MDVDRLLRVMIQELNLPQEVKNHIIYREIERVPKCVHPSPPQTPADCSLNPYAPSSWNRQPPTVPPCVNPRGPQTHQQQLGDALAGLKALQQLIQTLLAPPAPSSPPLADRACDHASAAAL